jgi:hypothetical protein
MARAAAPAKFDQADMDLFFEEYVSLNNRWEYTEEQKQKLGMGA